LGDGRILEGSKVSLTARDVQVLTLALHELATNAIKYGALSDQGGQLAIRWMLAGSEEAPAVDINWCESGVKLRGEEQDSKRGFGRELIERALSYDLGAETRLYFAEDGGRCELRIPIKSQASRE